MLGAPMGYGQQNGRPTKRPRNDVSANDLSPSVTPPFGQYQHSRLDGMHVDAPPLATSSTATHSGVTPAKAKQEEKQNRKLSCRECRRLKLKCDRVFPCQSCVKRGCGSLCPEGALTSGRGSRFILANTEQLHEKITDLSERVRQLEEALESAHSQLSGQPHPLLSAELLKIKTSQELYGLQTSQNPPQSQGRSSLTPSSDNGQTGQSSAANLPERTVPQTMPPTYVSARDPEPPEVGADILQLSATFPFPWTVDLKIRARIRGVLPPKDEALRICEQARTNAVWQFHMDASETFLPNLVSYCYSTPIEALSPRRLALLLMHLSIGSLVDLAQPIGSLHGEAYHHLARAAVCEIPLMEEPDFDVLHTLFFMMWYHLIFSDNKKAIGYAWNLMGFVAKLAQGLGLHRDSPRLKGIPEEHEKRRAVFWELLNMDARMSLSLGRPPSLCLSHVDTKPPTYVGQGIYVPREEIVYHEWKNNFFIHCLTPMLEVVVAVEPPDYTRVVQLDKAARDFGIPSILEEPKPREGQTRFSIMQKGLVLMSREIALLQLHRKYFTAAVSGPEPFDLEHRFAPSVLATYLAASSLISAVETLYDHEEQLTARFLHFWFNSFSAVVTLSLLVSRAPTTPLAAYALRHMDKGCRLFRAAAKILPFSGKALPIMQKLLEKSRRTLQHSAESEGSHSGQLLLTGSRTLPQTFEKSHPIIAEWAQRLVAFPQEGQRNVVTSSTRDEFSPSQSWLPDIYSFSSMGLSVEERYTFASAQPTPFVPSEPRISETDNFNFDYGAMTFDPVEGASFMAWF